MLCRTVSLEELHGYPLCVKADFQNGTEPLRLAHWLIPDRLLVGRYPFVHSNYRPVSLIAQILLFSVLLPCICMIPCKYVSEALSCCNILRPQISIVDVFAVIGNTLSIRLDPFWRVASQPSSAYRQDFDLLHQLEAATY